MKSPINLKGGVLIKIVILDSHTLAGNDLPLTDFNQFGEVANYNRTDPDQVVQRIGDAEIVLSNKTRITNEMIDACPNLQYIGILATGYNILDTAYAAQKGIVVTNIPSYSSRAVAQLTFAYLLQFANKVTAHDVAVKRGDWERCDDFCFYYPTFELWNKTIGLIGFGSIAQEVAKLAQAFGMEVLVYARHPKPKLETDRLTFTSLEDLLRRSDAVSIHVPLNDETQGMINLDRLSLMKQSALLINTARGPVVVEKDLAAALNAGLIAGAAVDVVSKEPIRPDNPLLKAKNCIITPHIAWASFETRKRLLGIAVDNIKAFLSGAPVNRVN